MNKKERAELAASEVAKRIDDLVGKAGGEIVRDCNGDFFFKIKYNESDTSYSNAYAKLENLPF